MIRGNSQALLIIAIFMLLFGCGHSRHVPVSDLRQNPYTATTYTVEKGDTLYAIAWRFNYDYKKLARANGIHTPYLLSVGQVLHLTEDVSVVHKKASPSTRKPAVHRVKRPPVVSGSKSSSNSPRKGVNKNTAKKVSTNNDKGWKWPVAGKVVRQFSPLNKLSKGIDIAAKMGTSICSSRSGKVVYAGSDLKGYGNLIIIRHDEIYLSAYAHNRKILVKEGMLVKQGQKIAELGSSGTQSPKLHFEIRKRGKPINPLALLPK